MFHFSLNGFNHKTKGSLYWTPQKTTLILAYIYPNGKRWSNALSWSLNQR